MTINRVVIIGASGRLGGSLVPSLRAKGYSLLLVGRCRTKLLQKYPTENCIGDDELARNLESTDCIIYLAAKNNDKRGSAAEFREANVTAVLRVLGMAERAGVEKFIHFSTIRCVGYSGGSRTDHYTQTKHEIELALQNTKGSLQVVNLRLAAVYGAGFGGKLKVLQMFPSFLRKYLVGVLGAIKPLVSMETVVGFVSKILVKKDPLSQYTVRDNHRGSFYGTVKRGLDIVGALVILVLVGWLMPIVWVAVRFDSRGPGIFVQARVGQNKECFKCYKFRTMVMNTKEVGTHEVLEGSVTRLGKYLRKYKIDELPQVWNVLINDMALVGPRPCLHGQVELVTYREAFGVYQLKPGITGLAQVSNVDMSEPEKLAKVDGDYVSTVSLLTDIRIIIGTLVGRGIGDRAPTST